MACNHKFLDELDLELIDYDPVTLIVGTFSPDIPSGEEWFHGRTDNNYFWNVLPRLYGKGSLTNATPAEWRQFCRNNQIAFTDLIKSIDDADTGNSEHVKMLSGFSDKAIQYNFDDFDFVDVVRLLKSRPTIKNVYIIRGVTEAFWRHLWNPVMQYCDRNGLHERRLLPPSDSASYQHGVYNEEHPNDKILLPEDYILMRWRQGWYP